MILSFDQDQNADWVVTLSCGHTQHVRHQPPWQNRAWVNNVIDRQQMLGQPFICGWCLKEQNQI